ncbi:uncharacterized protein LOC111065278 isoform X2 [Drosophila obscura]|uniref:uncharacterized protein LOC111065278 isoform X2 n=1 Tax=Drosophila obscura TaxID=7282 RepID=UPI001BB29E37|nr:uncharacterized protein LOC111065278 isoform X2 [Drosophila obscura]
MLRNLLKLPAAAARRGLLLCREVVNCTTPPLLQRSYKCPLEAVYPKDPANKIIYYRYPTPLRKSIIRLMQEANEMEKRRQMAAKCEEKSQKIHKETEGLSNLCASKIAAMLRNLLNLPAAAAAARRGLLLCREVFNCTTPPLLQRSYANKCPLEAVLPADPANKVIYYRYPTPPQKSVIRLMQEANEMEKRRQMAAKCKEKSQPIHKDTECVATTPHPKDVQCYAKDIGGSCEEAKAKVVVKSELPTLGNMVLRRRSWHLVKNPSEKGPLEPSREDDSSKYIVTAFQKIKFVPNVPFRKPERSDCRIKYEKVSATVRMYRRGN